MTVSIEHETRVGDFTVSMVVGEDGQLVITIDHASPYTGTLDIIVPKSLNGDDVVCG